MQLSQTNYKFYFIFSESDMKLLPDQLVFQLQMKIRGYLHVEYVLIERESLHGEPCISLSTCTIGRSLRSQCDALVSAVVKFVLDDQRVASLHASKMKIYISNFSQIEALLIEYQWDNRNKNKRVINRREIDPTHISKYVVDNPVMSMTDLEEKQNLVLIEALQEQSEICRWDGRVDDFIQDTDEENFYIKSVLIIN